MPPDVLANDHWLARRREQASRVQAARAREDRLLGAEPRVEAVDDVAVDDETVVRQRRRRLVDRLDAADAAESAAGRREEIPLPAAVDPGRTRSELDVDDILQVGMLAVRHDRHAGDIGGPANDALAVKKSERQLAVVSRCPHHHRQRGAADAYFQGLLGRELVVDPDTGLLAVAKHTRAVRAPIVHELILTNILPAIGDGPAAERHLESRSHQIGLDTAVERDQAVIRDHDLFGLLIGLDRNIPIWRGLA